MKNDVNWRRQCVEFLAKKPTDWVRLSELFAAVEPMIPLHFAMRHATRTDRNADIGVNTARWLLFLHHVNPLVERRSAEEMLPSRRAVRTDTVRLRPDKTPCADCGGPRFLKAWPKPGCSRQYVCPACTKPVLLPEVVIPEPVTVAAPTPTPAPPPVERVRPNAYQRRGERPRRAILTLPTPKPISKPSRPKQRVRRVYLPPPEPLAPPPPKPIVESKKIVAVDIGSRRFTFTNWRVYAQYVREFLGLGSGSINQIERELIKTVPGGGSNLAMILGKRGKTLQGFMLRLSVIDKAK